MRDHKPVCTCPIGSPFRLDTYVPQIDWHVSRRHKSEQDVVYVDPTVERPCQRCGVVKFPEEYPKVRGGGRGPNCTECKKEAIKEAIQLRKTVRRFVRS